MKTKYDIKNNYDQLILKENLIKILRKFFYEYSFIKDEILKQNIKFTPKICESKDFKINELDYNLIYFQIPLRQKNSVSLIKLNEHLIKVGFILEVKAEFRNNYSPVKTDYSKTCDYEIQILFNFKKGAKNNTQFIDNQLNLF